MNQHIIRAAMSFCSALGFGAIFILKGKKLLFAALGGFFSGILFELLYGSCGDFVAYFFCSVFLTVYAECAARILKTPVTVYLAPALIPLVPGGKLYQTMLGAMTGDPDVFFQNGAASIRIALALAAGILVVTPFRGIVNKKIDKANKE